MSNKQFENMQKLAFGKTVSSPELLNENALKDKIKELVYSSIGEAKKKKKKDVAPQDDSVKDLDINMSAEETTPEDLTADDNVIAPDTSATADINPQVKAIQDSLQKAFASAKQLGDEKLMQQIGNTITMVVRTQVLGGQVAESLNEDLDWRDDEIYDSLTNMDLENLASKMLAAVEENPSITLFEFLKQWEWDEEDRDNNEN